MHLPILLTLTFALTPTILALPAPLLNTAPNTLLVAKRFDLLDPLGELDKLKDKVSSAISDISKKISDTANCVGEIEFDSCKEEFEVCAKEGVFPTECKEGKKCLGGQGVDLGECF